MDSTVVDRFASLRVWKRSAQRAPHKPLLVLYALGQYARGAERMIPYAQVEHDLRKLLKEFGPHRASYHPEHPFSHLRSDKVWLVEGIEDLGDTLDVTRGQFLKRGAKGGLPGDIYRSLQKDPSLCGRIASLLLTAHFPDTVHEDILAAVGLDSVDSSGTTGRTNSSRSRDPAFREKVLKAYEYRCAVCGFAAWLADTLVGVEAAHVQWHQAGGPDIEQNGIALCSLHHKLFDRGVFTLGDNLVLLVSQDAHGDRPFDEAVKVHHGRELEQKAQHPDYYPKPEYVAWHVREVFQGEARFTP